MTKEERLQEINSIKEQISVLKKEADYYNALQLALKLVLNGSYGAFAAAYFVCHSPAVASSITAQGRELTKFMSEKNEEYWYEKWHLDTETHQKMGITGEVKQIPRTASTSIYADTDSVFVSYYPAMKSCNWSGDPLQFCTDMDKYKIADYFKECLDEFAARFHVENKQDFELEKINASALNIAKKKYILHNVWEDGILQDGLNNIIPKGVELVRSSTPTFVRDRVMSIINYLFTHPDDFNIKDLVKLVKQLRKEFELADIDDIAMQSSCSNYATKVLDDKNQLSFVNGAHFGVKASAYYNYLLHKNSKYADKYERIKGGKIKYYYCINNADENDEEAKIFAYHRGSHPVEFAPPVDYDTQFQKSILSLVNSLIQPLGLPEINKRLSVVMDIFGGYGL